MSDQEILNDKQKEAALTVEGPLLILAGAGSGKTRVLSNRAAYMIDECGIDPWNILAITFTNKAAGEMRRRIDRVAGFGADRIWVATFHSTCVRILRRYIDKLGYDNSFTIYDADDQKTLMKDVCKRLQIDTKQNPERGLLNAISAAKDELISPSDMASDADGDYGLMIRSKVYREYQDSLKRNNALDFDDLIFKTVELFRAWPQILDQYQERFRYIMVDEYQDTNTAQFELVRLLADKYRNICVVGDDDQSIYKFRGANIRNILDFEKHYKDAKVIKLEQNYRSTQMILDAANAVIKNNSGRKDKSLWTDKGEGKRIHFRQFDNAYEEAEYIVSDIRSKNRKLGLKYSDAAVLYRTNAQSRILEEKFIMAGLPYEIVGGVNFYSRREIKDILAYLRTIDNGADDVSVRRIINVPRRGIGATTINKITEYALKNDLSFYEALRLSGDGELKELSKSAGKLKDFTDMIETFRVKAQTLSLKELIDDVLESSGYIENIDGKDETEVQTRIENIEEFVNKAVAFEETFEGKASLSDFLSEVALVADIDKLNDDDNRVLLMTLHAAKGLEFPHVYLSGMEEGLFPSYMSIMAYDQIELEEERRLCYVGITRAMDDLTLTYAKSRMVRGETQFNAVSRFVKEIPPLLMDDKPSGGRIKGEERPFAGKSGVKVMKSKTMLIPDLPRGLDIKASRPDYKEGDRVEHIKFGQGIVKSISDGGRDYEVTVEFDSYGTKKMFAAFAKLKKI